MIEYQYKSLALLCTNQLERKRRRDGSCGGGDEEKGGLR